MVLLSYSTSNWLWRFLCATAAASQDNFKPPSTHGHTCTRGMLTAGTSCARNLPLLRAPLRNSKWSKQTQTEHTCTARHDGRQWMFLPQEGGGVLVPSVAQRQKKQGWYKMANCKSTRNSSEQEFSFDWNGKTVHRLNISLNLFNHLNLSRHASSCLACFLLRHYRTDNFWEKGNQFGSLIFGMRAGRKGVHWAAFKALWWSCSKLKWMCKLPREPPEFWLSLKPTKSSYSAAPFPALISCI